MRGKMLSTNNTAWGFWGTIAQDADARAAWALAMPAIMSEEAVRDFLDSRHGRHFADDVAQRCSKENQCTVILPQQRLYFLPDPQGHGSLRPTFSVGRR
jgi:hypothetical protein